MQISDRATPGVKGQQPSLLPEAGRGPEDSASSLPVDRFTRNDPDPGKKRITIISTNDLHGHLLPFSDRERDEDIIFAGPPLKAPDLSSPEEPDREIVGGLARIAFKIDSERLKNPGGVIVLDAGDINTGTPLSDILSGEPMVATMNAIGYDGMAVGNHEFDQGRENLKYLLAETQFPFLSANLVNKNAGDPLATQPYIIKEVNGVKIGIMGLTTPSALNHLNAHDQEEIGFNSPIETARQFIPEMKRKGAQVIVALSHGGLEEDWKMAERVDGIDIIVGGHSHIELKEPLKIRNTYITQAGFFGKKVSRLDIDLAVSEGVVTITGVNGRLIHIGADCPADPKIDAIITRYNDELNYYLGKKIGTTEVALTAVDYHNSHEESNLADFVTDTLRQSLHTDFCLLPPSSFRGNIAPGTVKVEDIYRIYPGNDGLSVITMTGGKLLNAIESGIDREALRIAPSGLRLTYDLSKPEGSRIVTIETTDGKPILPESTYTVVVRDFMLDNPGKYDEYKEYIDRKKSCNACQDIVIHRFREGVPINQAVDGRIRAVSSDSPPGVE